MSTAAAVRAAADYIEKHGLHKGDLYDRSLVMDRVGVDAYVGATDAAEWALVQQAQAPCCTYGALLVAAGGRDRIAHDRALAPFLEFVGWGGRAIGPWNDDEERTAEEVVAKLREFADTLDAGE